MTTFSYTSGNPNNLIGGSAASMADIQGPFTDIRTFVNGSISDTNLASNAAIAETKLAVASNGLAKGAFSAYRNAAQNPTTGTVISYDTEEFDVSGWFDTVTNAGRYTPQVPGYYRLSWMVSANAALAGDVFWQAVLRKNASNHKAGQIAWQRGTQAIGSGGAATVLANGTTDFFDIIITHGAGAGTAISATAAFTYFAGELIGRT